MYLYQVIWVLLDSMVKREKAMGVSRLEAEGAGLGEVAGVGSGEAGHVDRRVVGGAQRGARVTQDDQRVDD